MDRLLAMLLALIVGIGAMAGLDRYPHMGLHLPFWPHWGVDVPDSLSVQRDKALAANARSAADLATCHGNLSREDAALTAQNAAVAALKLQSDVWVAQSAKAVSSARSVAESYRQRAIAIGSETAGGSDLCVAAERVLRDGGE